MFDLAYEKTTGGYNVSGQTYHCKDILKSNGAKWCPSSKTWFAEDVTKIQSQMSMLKALNSMQLERFRLQNRKN